VTGCQTVSHPSDEIAFEQLGAIGQIVGHQAIAKRHSGSQSRKAFKVARACGFPTCYPLQINGLTSALVQLGKFN
jgi:hypothetical protein